MDIFQNLAVDMDTEGRCGDLVVNFVLNLVFKPFLNFLLNLLLSLLNLILNLNLNLSPPQVPVPELHHEPAALPELAHALLLLLPPLPLRRGQHRGHPGADH